MARRPKAMMPELDDYAEALRQSKGVMSIAAKSLGVTERTVHRKLQEYEELRTVLRELREAECDTCELYLAKIIRSESHRDQFKAIKWYLETHGRERGWGQPQRVEVAAVESFSVRDALASLEDKSPAEISKTYEQLRRSSQPKTPEVK